MRLRQLNLTRYGRFTDFPIDFGERVSGGRDLHIIYGPNEAGKSTAFNGYLDVLFGIEERSRYNFLHDYNALRIDGVLEIDGREMPLARIKRREAGLLGPGDQPTDPAILSAALHGLSREAYKTMFSLDDDTLEQGGEEILASKGDLGRLLFAASTGIGDLSEGLEALRERATKFYIPRARSSEFKTLKDELDRLEAERRNLDTQASTFASLTEAHKAAETAYGVARAGRDRLRAEHARLDALKAAFAVREDLSEIEAELALLAHLPDVPAGWIAEAGELQKQLAAAQAQRDDAETDIERIDGELAALVPDTAILELQAELAGLKTLAARDQTAREDLPRRREELVRIDAQLDGILSRLGADAASDLATLILPEDRIALLDSLSTEAPQLTQRLKDAQEEAADAAEALERAKEASKAVSPPSEGTPALGLLLDRQRDDDAQQRLIQAEAALEKSERLLAQALPSVAPWRGEAEDLLAKAFPTTQQAQRWREQKVDLSRRLAEFETERRQLEETHTRHAAAAKAMLQHGAVVGDADARKVRAARDEAWMKHRARLHETTADVFESALAEDDRIRDERLAGADRLAKLRTAETEAAAVAASVKAIDEAIAVLEADLTALNEELAPWREGLQLPEDFAPDDLPTWLEYVTRLREHFNEIGDCRAARDQAKDDLAAQRAALVAALSEVGKAPSEDLGLDRLRDMAQVLRDKAAEDKARSEAAANALESARIDKKRRDKAAQTTEAAVAAWETNWLAAFDGMWLEQKPASQIRALLTPLRELATSAVRHKELAGRIDAMEADCTAFGDAVSERTRSLDLDPEDNPAVIYASLQNRLAKAEKIETEREATSKARASAEDRRTKADSALARVAARVEEMAAHFPSPKEIAGLDGLLAVLHRAEQKGELKSRAQEKSAAMIRQLGVATRAAADQMLEAATQADVDARLAEIGGDLAEAEDELENRIGERRDALRAIEAIGGDDAAARLTEQRQTILLEISNRTDRAAALHLGVLAADRALALYRDRHRSELMLHTAEAFRTITGGEFADLKTQPDKAGDRLIALRANGAGSIGVEEMSKGTRFQLYLALRLAGYRRFCDSAGPLPFIGDDIMETFDDDRAAASIRLLGEIAQYGQALYFTHHRHLCEIAKSVCGKAVTIHEMPN